MRILILCTGNSCRSQMAAALLRQWRPDWEVFSAGTQPADRVHPRTVEVMGETGIDISDRRPQPVAPLTGQAFDALVTVCDQAKEACPVFSGEVARRLHHGFPDPALVAGSEEEVLAEFRLVRDAIADYFRIFAETAAS